MFVPSLLKQIALSAFGIAAGNYSGITHISGNEYAIVDDAGKTDGFKLLTLDIDPSSGKLTGAALKEPKGMASRRSEKSGKNRDCEGVAYCSATRTVFVSGENDQRILEYALDGTPTGRELAVPSHMQGNKIYSNAGFEALSYNATTHLFWTTTEATLKADGQCVTVRNTNVRNRLRITSFNDDLQFVAQYAYEMDLPKSKGGEGTYAYGVSSMVALDDGSLIVMEREAYIPSQKLGSFCHIKLYQCVPSEKCRITDSSVSLQSLSSKSFMKKKLLTEFTTNVRLGKLDFSNYEGMCLGPRLNDGRQTLILISDSQNGAGNSLFRLKDNVRIVILD